MSKSLALQNGDLNVTNRKLDVVQDQDKLLQDLNLWFRERIGTDPMTPTFGSTLDGGSVNGQEVTPFIGQILNPSIQAQISSEIYNQLSTYQQLQLEKMKAESIQFGGRNTLGRGELINSIDSVDVTNIGTLVLVRAQITTLANAQLTLTIPLDTSF